jgi:hypothetical protein
MNIPTNKSERSQEASMADDNHYEGFQTMPGGCPAGSRNTPFTRISSWLYP